MLFLTVLLSLCLLIGAKLISVKHICCEESVFYEPQKLIGCVNASVATRYEEFTSSISHTYGPKLSIILITRVTPEVYSYGAYAYFAHAMYAEHNGYGLLPLYADSSTPDYKFHRKLVPLLEVLEGNSSHHAFSSDADYVVWMDADAIFLHINFRIEALCSLHPTAHILISKDVSSIANSGVIIVKNTNWAVSFLHKWLSYSNPHGNFRHDRDHHHSYNHEIMTDQAGFEMVWNSLDDKERDVKVVILPEGAINSEAPPMGTLTAQHAVLHLASETVSYRQRVLRHGVEKKCMTINNADGTSNNRNGDGDEDGDDVILNMASRSRNTYHNNLNQDVIQNNNNFNITREFLLTTAIDIYGSIAMEKLDAFDNILKKIPKQPSSIHTRILDERILIGFLQKEWNVESISELRIVSSKLCYAWRYYYERETMQGILIRRRVDTLLRQYVTIVAGEDSHNGEILRNRLESCHMYIHDSSKYRSETYGISKDENNQKSSNIKLDAFSEIPELIKYSLELSLEYMHAILEMVMYMSSNDKITGMKEMIEDRHDFHIHIKQVFEISHDMMCRLSLLEYLVIDKQKHYTWKMQAELSLQMVYITLDWYSYNNNDINSINSETDISIQSVNENVNENMNDYKYGNSNSNSNSNDNDKNNMTHRKAKAIDLLYESKYFYNLLRKLHGNLSYSNKYEEVMYLLNLLEKENDNQDI